MLVLLGMFLVIVSLLLFSYYRLKANEDDYNRPSFFNSKTRKYILILCMILSFVYGEYLMVFDGFYIWALLLPIIYICAYYLVKSASAENIIISKTFNSYKIFSNPEFNTTKTDRLIKPVMFILAYAKQPAGFSDKATEYLAKRVAEGKIKTAKDLPNEVKAIIYSLNKPEIVQELEYKFSDLKIDYFYQKIIEGKKPYDLTLTIFDWLRWLEAQFERLFKDYAFISWPRPDFTTEEVQLTDAKLFKKDKTNDKNMQRVAIFSNIPVNIARKYGWVGDLDEYTILAALEFQRRFPEHKFSKQIKRQHKFTKEEIFDYAQNWEKLDISKIRLFS